MSVEIALKVVPGASRTRVAGLLGDRLKIQVAAPPEKGKANKMVEKYLAQVLSLPRGSVRVIAGLSNPLKTIAVSNWHDDRDALIRTLVE